MYVLKYTFTEHQPRTIVNHIENSFFLTLSQAAKLSGKSKSLIFKSIKSGKLSFIEKTTAGYKIDPAELERVFPKNGKNAQKEQSDTHENSTETLFLRRENELLRDTVNDLRQRLNESDQERRQLLNILTHQPGTESEPPVKSRLLEKLFGRK